MGRYCGFMFYRFQNGKLEKTDVKVNCWGVGLEETHDLTICGRCEATNKFSELFFEKKPNMYEWRDKLKPEERFSPNLLLTHPELDNLEVYKTKDDPTYKFLPDWFQKYFYVGIDKFKAVFDFEKVEKEHNDLIQSYKDDIQKAEKEIENIRCHQEKATTEAAFNGFDKNIQKLKERIAEYQSSVQCLFEDDYDYDHYMLIKKYIEIVEKLIEEDPDLVVVAYFSA